MYSIFKSQVQYPKTDNFLYSTEHVLSLNQIRKNSKEETSGRVTEEFQDGQTSTINVVCRKYNNIVYLHYGK